MRALAACASSASARLGLAAVGEPGLEGLDGDPRGDLAGLRAAHAVGDDEQRRARQQRVLVGAPLAARCRCRRTARPRAASSSVDLEGEFAVADAHAVARVQRPGRLQQLLVEVGAVGGAEVLDRPRCCPARRCARGARRRTGPRGGSRRDRRGRARGRRRGRRSSPARARGRARPPAAARGRRSRRVPSVEAEYRPVASGGRLGRHRRRVGHAGAPAAGRGGRCARPTAGTGRARRGSRTSARPIRARACSSELEDDLASSRARRGRPPCSGSRPRISRPLTTHAVGRAEVLDRPAVARRADLRVAARDAGVLEHDVAVAAAPDRRRRRAGPAARRPPTASSARARPARVRLLDRPAHARRGAVDHRLAVLIVAVARAGARPAPGRSL